MDNPIKPRLLELVEVARANKRAFIDGLSPAERDEAAVPGPHWTARDYLTHITFWEDQRAIRVEAQLRGEEPPPSAGEDDEVNGRVQAEYYGRSWDDLEAEITRVYARLIATIQAGSEAAWTDPGLHPSLQNRPLWLGIANNVLDHPAIHYSDYYRDHGDLAWGNAVREGVVGTVGRLFPDTVAYNNTLYNLGCYYALTGQTDQAIATVGEVLRRAPGLIEWSQQDSELDSLRDLPAFQALYANQA